MPLRNKHEQLVRAALETVWAAGVDLTRQPEWQPKVRSVDVLPPGPVDPTQKFTTLDRIELADVGGGVLVAMSSWFLNIGAVRLGISKTFRFVEHRQLRGMATRFAAVVNWAGLEDVSRPPGHRWSPVTGTR